MTRMDAMLARLAALIEMGGPVIAIIACLSVVTLAVILYKLWQFQASGVGRHHALRAAVAEWDQGESNAARRTLEASRSYLAPVIARAFAADPRNRAALRRIEAEAEARFSRLERGFRFLDTVAQVAPLLGLFGTVLGMIEAFQALQSAGAQVDPSLLAGGIWVALLTTAAGLAVAMPASVVLSWFESRIAKERALADHALSVVLGPDLQRAPKPMPQGRAVPQDA
ncbi:Biopolymer transport protein ExbB [Roseovarius tolerans]|uniref:Biopolymer transport protein ExbB n=1 Tax=Roseovarius tolerans TaxID=74031 RepID=A0A0L6D075_9RHOB|nr:MotA/TolQ/ExbB proton channel family protein [Roseovarius tolerans]KNX43374.1 Biopolymer transport protein ExbB [Roseovarius tolerans]